MNRESQIEAVLSAHRDRDPRGEWVPSPELFDLSPEDRERAARAAIAARTLEAALDPEGLSSTARAVLARIRGT